MPDDTPKACPTRLVRVTTHQWGAWGARRFREDGTPFRQRKCAKCGKAQRRYSDRGY